MPHLAYNFGVAKSTVSDTIILVENDLIRDHRRLFDKIFYHIPNIGRKEAETGELQSRFFSRTHSIFRIEDGGFFRVFTIL